MSGGKQTHWAIHSCISCGYSYDTVHRFGHSQPASIIHMSIYNAACSQYNFHLLFISQMFDNTIIKNIFGKRQSHHAADNITCNVIVRKKKSTISTNRLLITAIGIILRGRNQINEWCDGQFGASNKMHCFFFFSSSVNRVQLPHVVVLNAFSGLSIRG